MSTRALSEAGIAHSSDALDLDAARRDLWPRATLAMREGSLPPRPAVVTWPRTADDVAAVLAWASAEGRPVVPYGAGSGVCGGAQGMDGAVVVDTKRMLRIGPVDRVAGTVRCEPGVLGQHLEDHLAHHGLMTAHSPSSIMCSTVGGYVAARSAGQFSSRYGVFDDMLLAAEAVCPSGRLRGGRWTPQGEEDLLPVLCGSEGTLGVVTDTLLRVVPLPEQRWFRAYALPDLETAWAAMRALMQSGLWPSVLRLYDPLDTRIGGPARKARKAEQAAAGGDTGPSIWHRLQDAVQRVPSLRHHLLDLPLALPGLVNRLASGIGDEVLLVVGLDGSPAQLAGQVPQVEAIFSGSGSAGVTGARDLGAAPGEHWYAHRHEVSYKLAPIFVAGGWADTMEVATTWARLPALHEAVRAALGRHAVVMAHFSHAYAEGCSIYFSFAGAGRLEVYDAAWQEALAAARAAGGTVTHHHGVGRLKAEAAAREAGAAVRIWRELREELDPQGLMNPGRLFVRGDERAPGPPRPEGGPVYSLDPVSRLAEVDPSASPEALQAALARLGHRLRFPPDRPLLDWLLALERGVLAPHDSALFAVQARFDDGVSVRLGPSPRSAAGPDLRWSLLRRATAELLELPVLPVDHPQSSEPISPRLPAPGAEEAP